MVITGFVGYLCDSQVGIHQQLAGVLYTYFRKALEDALVCTLFEISTKS